MPEAAQINMLPVVGWLVISVTAAGVYGLVQLARSEYSLWENCLYLPTYLMGRLVWRVHFQNQPPEELKSGAVLAANHRSSVDPFFVQLAAKRRVHWMVAKEFCNHPLFGPLLSALQVIPTNRSGMDTASTKAAMRLTSDGRLVGMFPEGRINRSPKLLEPIRSGAAVVAQRAGVPIIPLLIEGSPMRDEVWSPVFMPANVSITFGIPITVDQSEMTPSETHSNPTDQAMLAWGKQLSKMAGQPPFSVELASARSRRRGRIENT